MNAVEKVFALLERAENAEFFCRHFKEDRDRALTERDAALAKLTKRENTKAEEPPIPYDVACELYSLRAQKLADDAELETIQADLKSFEDAFANKVAELVAMKQERDALQSALADGIREERKRLCKLFTTMEFNLRKHVPSSTETVGLTTESALREAEKGQS